MKEKDTNNKKKKVLEPIYIWDKFRKNKNISKSDIKKEEKL